MSNKENTIVAYNEEIKMQLSNEGVQRALLATTFKGLQINTIKQALLEGMMRGFKFKDFLEKNVYAIPFSGGYSLITSIDYARKIGMRSGVVGVSAPSYEEKNDEIVSCTVIVKKKVEGEVGEFSATVYFKEYSTGFNLWKSKPRTMIAKVAEMHALRKACPEELSQAYTEEEVIKETVSISAKQEISDELRAKVENAKTEEELKVIWEENKGLGREFGQLVVAQKKFIKEVNKDDKNL